MSQPGQLQRHPNRLHRPHAGQSVDPTLTRKGALAHPGSLLVGFGALFFFAYVFNLGGLQTYLDGLASGLDTSARSRNSAVANWVIQAIPYVAVGVGAVALFIILNLLAQSARSVHKERTLSRRDEVSLDQFLETAHARGVSGKVAREAYRMLLPHYHDQMRVTLDDRLLSMLQMKPVEISDLYGNLLRHTDRQRAVGDNGGRLDTVLDLLMAVEKSIPRSLSQSKLHQRTERKPHPQRRPSFGQRVKESLLRSVVRQAAPSVATSRRVSDSPSVIKPARLAVREEDLKSSVAAEAVEAIGPLAQS